ncbi:ribosome small subunit-dependent GTPase A [Lachnoclostridium phytofermentans]|uniref:Small ribosomal subunit biogenesis GTPase RsgA n=1 Tax=Lachnoclostridium phytofermentans (strain ATCC 700394 / DSM 18823 / ISDg) TaxID=357809 RepID=A9KMS1_LACP7|nr:ribosome small subunit-dependent GTPase A [Lachnoclostridium phytofermentans]ABX41516.1 ribosome small subunit-dependent GTPase A [Lachnoclostridium phytofermentans ISDg]
MNLQQLGFSDYFKSQITANDIELSLIPARVSAVHKESYELISEYGESNAKLKSSLFYKNSKYLIYPAVGDFVLIKHNELGDDIIYRILNRKSYFTRNNPGFGNYTGNEGLQSIASNFDYVFLMESLNQDFNVRRMERYLSTAYDSGATPIIILTKADLCDDVSEKIAIMEQVSFGVKVVAISAITGEGLDQLVEYLTEGTTFVFLGSSGIGKSSLVNALAGKEMMKVSNIREDDDKGRHTTTHRELISLENGVMIIDTPGMRELGLSNVESGLSSTFQDIDSLSEYCKFQDCKHEKEPGCAVNKAIEDGTLSLDRLRSYHKLQREVRHSSAKAAYQLARTTDSKSTSKQQNYSRKKIDY